MKKIEIGDFKGLFTNADPADIPPDFAQVMRKLRPVNGSELKIIPLSAGNGKDLPCGRRSSVKR